MLRTRNNKMVWLGLFAILAPALSLLLANQTRFGVVAPGSALTENGAWINVGQVGVGSSRSSTHRMVTGALPILVELSAFPADLDGDGDSDLDDHAILVVCLAGPRVSLPPRGCSADQFRLADLQGDTDVDMNDYAVFAVRFPPG